MRNLCMGVAIVALLLCTGCRQADEPKHDVNLDENLNAQAEKASAVDKSEVKKSLSSPLSEAENEVLDDDQFHILATNLKQLNAQRAENSPLDNLASIRSYLNDVNEVVSADSLILGYAKNLEGSIFYDNAMHEEALLAFDEALRIYEKNNHLLSEDAVTALASIPNILEALKRPEAAETAYEKSAKSTLAFFGSPSAEYGKVLCEEGFRHYYRNDLKNSLLSLEAGIVMLRETIDWKDINAVNDLVSYQASIGAVYNEAGQMTKSLQAAEDSVQTSIKYLPEKSLMRANVLHNYGGIMNAMGRFGEGADVLKQALKIHREVVGKNHPMTAYSIYNLAVSEGQLGNFAVSETLSLEAHDMFKVIGKTEAQAANLTLSNAARMASAQGQHSVAIKRFETAIAGIKSAAGADNVLLVTPLQNLAVEYLVQGDNEKASDVLNESGVLVEQHHDANHPTVTYNDMLTAITASDSENAMRVYENAKLLVAETMKNKNSDFKPSSYAGLFERFVEFSLANKSMDDAIEALQYARMNSLTEITRERQYRQAQFDPLTAKRIRQLQDLQRDVSRAEDAYQRAIATNDANRIEIKKKNLAKVTAKLYDFEAMPLANLESPDLFPSLDALQDNLAPQDALLITFQSKAFPKTVVILKDKIISADFNMSQAELKDRVSSLRNNLKSQQDAFDYQNAHALYREIFSPKIRQALDGVKRIKVAPEQDLTQIPFSLLVSELSSEPDFLIDDFALSVLPSIGSLAKPETGLSKTIRFLGIGDPLLGGAKEKKKLLASNQLFFRNGRANVNAINDLPDLPNSGGELTALRKAFATKGSRLLTESQATEEEVLKLDLEKFDVIAFSTHALVSGDFNDQNEPALVLTPPELSSAYIDSNDDGLLTQSEISRLRLNADWVILSACNTAAGSARSADGLTGLASAFLYAGADSLLVSHWPVRDDVASYLTVNMVKNTQAEMDKATALQSAINMLRQNKRIPDANNPAIWAPFVLVGN